MCIVTRIASTVIHLCVNAMADFDQKHSPHEAFESQAGVMLVCAVNAQRLRWRLSLFSAPPWRLACCTFLGMVLLLVLLVLIRCCCCCCGDEKVGYANAVHNTRTVWRFAFHLPAASVRFDVMLLSCFQPRRRKVGIENMGLDSWAQRCLGSISFTKGQQCSRSLCAHCFPSSAPHAIGVDYIQPSDRLTLYPFKQQMTSTNH